MVFYQFTFNTVHEVVDGEIRFIGKQFKDLPEMYSRHTKSRIKLKLEEGRFGVWKEGVGYTNGMLGTLQNCEANTLLFPVSLYTKDPPGVFTTAVEENTYHLASVTQKHTLSSFNLLNNLISIELFCWLLYFTLLFKIFSISNFVHLPKLIHLKYRLYGVVFEAVKAILTGHIHGSSKTVFLLAFACLLTALFGAIVNSSFNTSAIVRSTKEQVKSLSDIIKMNKNPWFFDGISQYELFEAGVTPEFRQVYEYAVKKGLETPKELGKNSGIQLSRDCLNAVALATLQATEFMEIYLEYICSIKLGSPQCVFVSNPYHKAVKMSLINPCTDGPVAEEMIRRDKSFYSVLLETGINLRRMELSRSYTIKSTLSLLGLETRSQTDDSNLYSLSASPLNLSNFEDLFIIQFFAAVMALFIEFGNQIYYRYVKQI
ncbi:uncharacterized protein LOC107369933 [Tetranychus urticae]|uniref:uncharacterized protein LOC107369933 n=1 Tax=Tetranychus urticae TaxID=32264 RepID=UPI00077BBDB1|nr:uncharacterized protein LOC107369933 [Tetranychus urticae]